MAVLFKIEEEMIDSSSIKQCNQNNTICFEDWFISDLVNFIKESLERKIKKRDTYEIMAYIERYLNISKNISFYFHNVRVYTTTSSVKFEKFGLDKSNQIFITSNIEKNDDKIKTCDGAWCMFSNPSRKGEINILIKV